MTLAELPQPKVDRRTFMKAAAAVGTAIIAPNLAACSPEASIWPPTKENWPYGSFVDIDGNGNLILTEGPVAVEVQFTPPKRPHTDKINIFRKPSHEHSSALLKPSEINTYNAVRVLGNQIVDGRVYKVRNLNGTLHIGGIWYMLVDNPNDKNPVSPNGYKINSGDSPYFVDEKSLTVIKSEEGKITFKEINPIGYYDGKITIVKEKGNLALSARRSPNSVSDENLVEWSDIISLNGSRIDRVDSFFVINSYISNGQNRNPTGFADQPSKWLAFIARVKDPINPGKTKEALIYLNLSSQTSGYVIPDRADWTHGIVSFAHEQSVSDNNIPGNLGNVTAGK